MKPILAAALIVLVFAGVFVHVRGKHLQQDYADALRRSRFQRAANIADDLAAIGRAIPDSDRATLDRRIRELERSVETQPTNSQEQYTQVIALAQLDRFAEAERILRDLPEAQEGAMLLLATILQAQGQYAESDRLFEQGWQEAKTWRTLPPLMPRYLSAIGGPITGWSARDELAERRNRADANLQRCAEGLAYNARQQRQHTLAKTIYRQAIAEHPTSAAAYHYQLGMTCLEVEHFTEAVAAFQAAERLDSRSWADSVRKQLSRIRAKSQGCQIRSQTTDVR